MIVMKFGGTSVGSAAMLERVAGIVAARRERRPVVVVSALGGVTDLLEAACAAAGERDAGACARAIGEVEARHREALQAVTSEEERQAVSQELERVLSEVRLLLDGMRLLGETTPRSRDAVLAIGERLSSHLAAAALVSRGLPAERVDARQVVVTERKHGHAAPLAGPSRERALEQLASRVDAGRVPVLGGFIGATAEGVTTTLGRGGSDLSASFLGALLGAEEIEIWTDVDGILSSDPRIVKQARLLPVVSFDEAAELAYFGARVLHPATIGPALERGIPVAIRNTMRPAAACTRIVQKAPVDASPVRAIACKRRLTVMTVTSLRMLMAHGFLSRIFAVFERHQTPVDLIATSEVSVSLTIDDPASLEAIREELAGFARVQVEPEMAIVCIVGQRLLRERGVAGRAFEALRGINVRMISLGASEINLSLVVAEADATEAVQSLHRAFFDA